jgi:hypothetical protein
MALGDSNFIPLDPQLFNDNNELSKLKNYILRQLGWPLIRVEITEEQLVDSIVDAVQVYHEYAAIDYNMEVVPTVIGNIVDIPSHINQEYILDVIFERDYYDSFSSGLSAMGFQEVLGGVLPYALSGSASLIKDFDIAGYFLYQQHMEDFKKMIGIRDYFEIINGKIHLMPANRIYKKIGIIYKGMLTEKRIEQIPWIKKYAVAKASIIVGTIRSKLGGFSSTGTNIAVDGADLISRGREDVNTLEEKLNFLGVPMPFIQG